MSKVPPLLRSGLLVLAVSTMGTAMAAPLAHADVKYGVDAWSAGDYDAAIAQWRPLADRGDPDAQFNLAQAYKMGRGVPMDVTKAEELYGQAAAKGHTQAADAYGLLLFQRGERARSLPYIQASAARGDSRAQYILGVAHFNGDMVPKDWVRAYALVSLAQQEGLPQATGAKTQMDQHIPLADRQKSVVLAQQIAAQAAANRARLNTSAELGTRLAAAEPTTEIAEGRGAAAQATRVAGTDSPSTAGADYTRSVPAPKPVATPAHARAGAAAPTPKPAATVPKPAAKPAVAASGPWRAQLGAFGVAGNADSLWTRVKSRPELAGHAKALVPAGKLVKLQATGFASRGDAEAACSRLTAGGFGCLPVRD